VFIHEMSEFQCRKVLEQASFGRLACARDNQPYVVPIYFTFDGEHLYGFTTLGQKIEWMRINPQVCVEIDDRTSHEQWVSIVVFGRYEELPDLPEFAAARAEAHELLQRRAMWWEPAYVASEDRDIPHSLTPIFYRVHIDRITGHRATPEVDQTIPEALEPTPEKQTWWDKILKRLDP